MWKMDRSSEREPIRYCRGLSCEKLTEGQLLVKNPLCLRQDSERNLAGSSLVVHKDDTGYNYRDQGNDMAKEWDKKVENNEYVESVDTIRRAGNTVSMQSPAIKCERTYLSSLTTATMTTSKALLFVTVFAVS
jgi:hypothetical protein